MKVNTSYEERIICDPKILVGKPVIKRTRISVELVLEYLEYDPTMKELFAAFPRLTIEDVKACIAYARELVETKKTKQAQVAI